MRLIVLLLAFALSLAACGEPALRRPDLPPSASDLNLLGSAKLCDAETSFVQARTGTRPAGEPWGTGRQYSFTGDRRGTESQESYFFNEEGLLVGALYTFPSGLDLKPYPVLRDTLKELQPAFEFYLNFGNVTSRANLDTSALYKTGEEKTTFQYLVLGGMDHPVLLAASFTLDPYEALMSPYRKEFIQRLTGAKSGMKTDVKGSEDKEPFALLQQFARGEVAHLAYCDKQNEEAAVDAYRKAIAMGITNKARLADSHHKLGLALKNTGHLKEAQTELERSLEIRPNVKEVYNNLGTIYKELGQRDKALEAFDKAVRLSPNYPVARFNLAEAYEESDPRRAVTEYETYLVLAEGYPEEEARVMRAQKRVKELKRR
jgi:tetratricopeptide (TPR) repeat protein